MLPAKGELFVQSSIQLLVAFLLGVASAAAYSGIVWLFGRALNPLKITEPAPGEVLKEPLEFAPACTSYLVKGTLRHLPKNHKIWLLEQSPTSSQVEPQAFQEGRVILRDGHWEGRVYPSMAYSNRTTIVKRRSRVGYTSSRNQASLRLTK